MLPCSLPKYDLQQLQPTAKVVADATAKFKYSYIRYNDIYNFNLSRVNVEKSNTLTPVIDSIKTTFQKPHSVDNKHVYTLKVLATDTM